MTYGSAVVEMMLEIELKYYDQETMWYNYDSNISELRRAEKTVDIIPTNVQSVIDIGCGSGIVTNMINKPFVVGLDFARIPLTKVQTNAIQATIDQLPIKSTTFDLILMSEVLEHLNNEMYIKAIDEIKRLRGRYLLISVPFEEFVSVSWCKCNSCGNVFNIHHHYRDFNDDWFKSEFPEYDLERIEYTTYRIPPNKTLYNLKHIFDVYLSSDVAVCNKCGGHPRQPNRILRYLFGGVGILDRIIKRTFRVQKPYHMIILLKRRQD